MKKRPNEKSLYYAYKFPGFMCSRVVRCAISIRLNCRFRFKALVAHELPTWGYAAGLISGSPPMDNSTLGSIVGSLGFKYIYRNT